jgi:hypothetical protein
MVERFNGRISEVVNQTRFASRAELESTLRNYLKIYNHNIPQRTLDNVKPIQAMKKWQEKKPELFVKRVYNQASLDTYSRSEKLFCMLDGGWWRYRYCLRSNRSRERCQMNKSVFP